MIGRLCVVATLLAVMLATGAQAQWDRADDPGNYVVSDLVIVAPAEGPAWWKATKGDSVVWIMGLPTSRTPRGLVWPQQTLKRRLKGARFLLAPVSETSGFKKGDVAPRLPADMARKVINASARLGEPISGAPTIDSAMNLRALYNIRNRLTRDVETQIRVAAIMARVRIVTPTVYQHRWIPSRLAPTQPDVAACMQGVVDEVAIPPERHGQAAAAWAKGDVKTAIAVAPRGVGWTCRRFWPGHWERTIAFQTKAIAEALETPGKVVAVVYTDHLVAQDGVLQRLRAQGYTIADPAQPLTE